MSTRIFASQTDTLLQVPSKCPSYRIQEFIPEVSLDFLIKKETECEHNTASLHYLYAAVSYSLPGNPSQNHYSYSCTIDGYFLQLIINKMLSRQGHGYFPHSIYTKFASFKTRTKLVHQQTATLDLTKEKPPRRLKRPIQSGLLALVYIIIIIIIII
jgi:hypothetical protein